LSALFRRWAKSGIGEPLSSFNSCSVKYDVVKNSVGRISI